ncbi:DUF6903 family protein [Schleiferilactobacillus harbinensis]
MGYAGLGVMLIGLLAQLWAYNWQYQ